MARKLVSMKIDPKTREDMNKTAPIAVDAPVYPWGLAVNLDNDALEKLDLDVSDLKVGGTMMLIAKVEVTGLSSNASKSGENQSTTLQITEMCLEAGSGKELADVLYAASEKKKS